MDYSVFKANLSDDKDVTLTILQGGYYSNHPQEYMDDVVDAIMGDRPYNEFIEEHMDIPQLRVIVESLNDLSYVEREMGGLKYEIFEKELTHDTHKSRIMIIRGGLTDEYPYNYMNQVVDCITNNMYCYKFVKSNFGNPYIRIIIENFNNLDFETKEIRKRIKETTVTTVKDLIEALKHYPDDMPVYTQEANTMEKSGYTNTVYVRESEMYSRRVDTWDRFDGEAYSYIKTDVYNEQIDKNTDKDKDFKGPFEGLIIG